MALKAALAKLSRALVDLTVDDSADASVRTATISGTQITVTLLAAVLDRRSGALTLANAGHPALLRRRLNGAVEAVGELDLSPALGLLPGRQY